MTLDVSVNILGNLRDVYKQLQFGTMCHVDQLMTERRANKELSNLSFYTADGALYFMDGPVPKLALTREPNNLIFRYLDEALGKLAIKAIYHHNLVEAQSTIQASTTEVFDLTKLDLKRYNYNNDCSFIEISTTKYNELNPEQQRLAQRVYGTGDEFVMNMRMFKQNSRSSPLVFLLSPDYVKEHARVSPIGQVSWLYSVMSGSYFGACGRGIDYQSVRGIPREIV